MGTTLTGTTPQDTYDSLIKVTNNGPLSSTARYLSDGLGNDSVLALSTSRVGIGTTSLQAQLHIDGTTAESSFIMERDTVGANAVIGQIKFTNNNGTTTYGTLLGGRNAAGDGYSALGTGVGTNLYAVEGGNVGIGTSSPDTKLRVKGIGGFLDADLTETGIRVGANENYYWQFSRENINFGHLSIYEKDNTTPVERLRFTHASGGSYLRLMSGTGGIQFNGDTAAANALDDYEEGTWTPTISFGYASVGVTYGLRTATYTKIGRQVTVNGYILLSNKGTSTGTARIGSLPFTISAGAGFYCAASFGALTAITYDGTLQGFGDVNSTNIELNDFTEAGVQSPITNADFSDVSQIIFSLTYFV